jgi:ribonuclease J
MFEQYVGKVDYVVCEATNILRPNATSKKESALQRDFVALFKEKKSTVVYLSSTNIDRLFSLYHAALKAGRPFYVDGYQKHMMDVVVNSKSLWTKSSLYQYGKYEPEPLMYHRFDKNRFFVSDSFKAYLDKLGYVLIARNNERFDNLLEQIPGEKQKVLSMWDGYVKEGTEAYNENLANSLDGEYDYMHTSGHSDMNSMREVFRLLHPKALIPIHTDAPEKFAEQFSDEWPVKLLNDGDSVSAL